MDSNKLLFECVDIVLNSYGFIDKVTFYSILQSNYNVDLNKLMECFDTFHLALKEVYGLNHYQIERALLRTLHERTKQGYYKQTDEVDAYYAVTQVIIAESQAKINEVKEWLGTGKG